MGPQGAAAAREPLDGPGAGPGSDPDAALPARLVAARDGLLRGSTADRVADALREMVVDGVLVPGARLREDAVSGSLGVSRNTLREAFRLLGRERLVRHELHRGVFVRSLEREDVADVYRVRRLLEQAGVAAADPSPAALARVRAAVDEGWAASRRDDWSGVGTANMHFHQALVALAGSPRMDESMRHLLAELRLAFSVMADLRPFHEPYLEDNARLAGLLEAGDRAGAAARLADYLDRAERQLLDAHGQAAP
ncbi:GntR family transcriptional regulator [Vallicoccus soli]|uniref:GntR family transcriptional regulator n=1 Tax=Vallicoccus soli TaxID=2339232 RepID=A0A3A3ZKH6_9ACTN|nr:GntR family transcriptional regulator [Vallicoccus soli]RJK96414.1 GntR family transcriptional regulator [Vallicoccus soli]